MVYPHQQGKSSGGQPIKLLRFSGLKDLIDWIVHSIGDLNHHENNCQLLPFSFYVFVIFICSFNLQGS